MARNKATGGGGDWLPKNEWLALGEEQALLIVRPLELLPTEDLGNGDTYPVLIDVLVVTGERAGEVIRGTKVNGAGQTGPLRRAPLGEDMTTRMGVGQRGANLYPQFNTPSEADDEKIEKLYPEATFDWSAVEKLWLARRGDGMGSADDEPPF